MKICIICKQAKELSDYYKHPQTLDGYLTKCKECQKENSRKNFTPEKDRARYIRNPRRRLQIIYRGINNRCNSPKDNHYKRYGARWIRNEWENFEQFYNDMKDGYINHYVHHLDKRRNTQIDRIDNNWNYCKDNCRRVTAKENVRNSSRNFNPLTKQWPSYSNLNTLK